MAACFCPLNYHWLAWIALVPFLLTLPKLTPGSASLCGTIMGLVFYRIGLAWMFRLNGPLAGGVIVGLAIWMGFSFRVARLLMDRFSPRAMLWAVPLTFAGQEVLRCEGHSRFRFPFLAWGYSQSHNLWISQVASMGGVYFISFLLVLVASAIAWFLSQKSFRSFVPALVCITAVLGLAVISQPRDYASLPKITVACVQAETYKMSVFSDLATQAAQMNPRPSFIVLPEHTITDYATESHGLVNSLMELAKSKDAFICVGAHTRAPRGAICDFYNVAMLIGPQRSILSAQAKCVPIPFFNDGAPGESQGVTPTPHGVVGSYVCYEGLFTDIARREADLGAEILLVPNMDPEPWPDQERFQHAEMAPIRSIELRRCAVRANSAGISEIVDATGSVIARRTKQQGPGILAGKVYAASDRTLFARGGFLFARAVGYTFVLAIVGLTLSEWAGGFRRRISQSGAPPPVSKAALT